MAVFPEQWRGICLEIQGKRSGGCHKHKIIAYFSAVESGDFCVFFIVSLSGLLSLLKSIYLQD